MRLYIHYIQAHGISFFSNNLLVIRVSICHFRRRFYEHTNIKKNWSLRDLVYLAKKTASKKDKNESDKMCYFWKYQTRRERIYLLHMLVSDFGANECKTMTGNTIFWRYYDGIITFTIYIYYLHEHLFESLFNLLPCKIQIIILLNSFTYFSKWLPQKW